jgi:hypothetical protein
VSTVDTLMQTARRESHEKRARVFRDSFVIGPSTRVLAMGAGDGAAVAAVLVGTGAQPTNVYLAGVNSDFLEQGHRRYGFVPVAIPESGLLPFEDGFFDIVFCASTLEHIQLPETDAWGIQTDEELRQRALPQQRAVAEEIRRLGRGYYVQTPNKWFPIESHTWLPFIAYLPRPWQLQVISWTNRYWIKRTRPEWSLLTVPDMQSLFPDATIRRERFLGLTKSIMAIRSPST